MGRDSGDSRANIAVSVWAGERLLKTPQSQAPHPWSSFSLGEPPGLGFERLVLPVATASSHGNLSLLSHLSPRTSSICGSPNYRTGQDFTGPHKNVQGRWGLEFRLLGDDQDLSKSMC